ncbi:NAD-dependent epimerase/dehydratase family protein [Anatilimnocola floriformis]|uniref:NAD-dependent epimerase/dehydratase family protein n=1 Tax=Anatilimnocola floriformis TaxID=2948575 RepID=UPI0020C3A199|nr:NAD-dependent epimerase/dehydratase family protein [Anatilimnocola floriformis]
MVDPRVVEAVRELLRDRPLRILITGGTGFVGSRVASVLAEAGQQVTVTGRNFYRQGRARHPKTTFVASDLCDQPAIERLCLDHDVVIHAAALAAIWGDAKAFEAINVRGTQIVADACRQRPGTRLVHVSSTAIHFDFIDKLLVEEDAALPMRFANEYAKSKADAEEVIRRAVAAGVNAVTIRARAVFGPGDNSLLPRLLLAASKGRLPQIGDGSNLVDLTYVDNLAYALCLAIVRGEPGDVCTVTNESPVLLWPTLQHIFQHLKMPATRRKVSYKTALAIANLATFWHRIRRRRGEPVLTTYSVGLLAKTQTFSPAAAQKMLGYRAIVSMEEGQQRTLESLTARDESAGTCAVDVKLFTTGYTPQPYYLAERGQGRNIIPFHATCALITHPQFGHFLFDTGYAPRFRTATARFPYSIYGRLSPVVCSESLTIRAQLQELGIDSRDIRGIILSHYHADHVAGLRDFPSSDFISSQAAWSDVAGRSGFAALRRGFLPALLSDDFAKRLHTIESFHDPGFGPFSQTHDLFGDGSVRLIQLPGHARGQIGAIVQQGPAKRTLLAADAIWTLGSLRANALPHWKTFSFVDSVADMRTSLNQLHELSQQHPAIEIVPTHCPEIADRYSFGSIVKARLPGSAD